MIKNVFWRNVLAIITLSTSIFMVIIAVTYLPYLYLVITSIYAFAVFFLSIAEIGINLDMLG